MNSTRVIAATLTIVLGLAAGSVAARQWRATPSALATDYAQIIDQRSGNEIALVIWLPPEMIEDTAQNQAGREALAAYVIIGVVHARISSQAVFTFSPPSKVLISVGNGAPRRALEGNAIAPVTVGILTAMQSAMANALGPMGEGITWYAFDATDISSCGNGEFWVSFAGEDYNYETPIPGCPSS